MSLFSCGMGMDDHLHMVNADVSIMCHLFTLGQTDVNSILTTGCFGLIVLTHQMLGCKKAVVSRVRIGTAW